MMLFEFSDGKTGASYNRCYVIAKDYNRALDLALEQYFKQGAKSLPDEIITKVICHDVSKDFVTNWSDEGPDAENDRQD